MTEGSIQQIVRLAHFLTVLFFFLVSGVLEHSFKLEECLNASATTDESDDPRLGPFSLEGCSST